MIRRYMFIGSTMGALGVITGAVAAHAANAAPLQSVSLMLLVHGAVLVSIALHGTLTAPLRVGTAFLAFGTTLFAAEVSQFTLQGTHLFSHAAPIGGSCMIAGWVLLALSALPFNKR